MAEPQYKRIYDRMKASGERLSHLDWFSSKLAQARMVEPESNEWIRLDRVAYSEEEIFRNVAFSMDYEFGLDAAGNIYVSKDHALNIQEWEHDRTKNKLDVARNWAFFLAVAVALGLMARCST